MSNNVKRTRSYISILYPESAKENWQDILAESCVPAIVSPLHDKDINPDGEPKKPHYHVLLLFNGPKTPEQAQIVFDSIGAIKCMPCSDTKAQARYFIHKDNPEKYQYDPNDISNFGGADWSELVATSADMFNNIAQIEEYIRTSHINSYADLCDTLRQDNFELYKVAVSHTIHIKAYLQSITWSETQNISLQHGSRYENNPHTLPNPAIE